MDDLPLPLPQSPEFARTCAALGLPHRCHDEDAAVWQIQSRRLPVLGQVDLLSRGPVWRDPSDTAGWLRGVGAMQRGRPLILNADGLSGTELRAAGFWPLVTPVTLAMLRLGPEAAMRAALRQKWRNRLNRAEQAGLKLDWSELAGDRDHWLLQAEEALQKHRGYRGWPPTLLRAFGAANPGKARIVTARRNGHPVAAALFLCHGAMATYQIGQSLPEGRRLNAMNLVLWEGMRDLAARGHSLLDLGTLNADDAPGLAHFKLGTGADAVVQGGTWLYHRALAPVARRLPKFFAA
ncbi:GNAT family N-acetyltransferase [Puniceibacterium sediminis]|uniref:Acetyltransferase (GNAT) domain-containing protein n=1 Tax=Puniceibacterium sediminis TaxID=1608407 RepID=A0A238XP46_9RHOB|nr:GNAT family N-acetyltransferase [Puniceibacterium sediminis]SNR60452.1 Acetyltransferase (GNAT) domain-containing protein [Puniceibacterium sediminis]